MRIVELHETDLELLNGFDGYNIYNGFDVLVDCEIAERLAEKVEADPHAKLIYDFERACLAPAFDMMKRGIRVDLNARAAEIGLLTKESEQYQELLDKLAHAVWGKPLNPNSPKQLKDMFYNELMLEPIYVLIKGERKESTNSEALEKLESRDWIAGPFIYLIRAIRERTKLVSTLRSAVGADGRMRFSFNVGATETGRWSASINPFGEGTNAQNLTQRIRRIFVADLGHVMVYRDLSGAESRYVGAKCYDLFGLKNYLAACDHPAGIHSVTARELWPELGWPTDHGGWRAVADQKCYRHFSYYDLAKRGGHAKNYRITAPTMAKHLHIPLALAEEFEPKYYGLYPELPKWHQWVIEQVQSVGSMVTALGRKRTFLGRPDDQVTWREAIAHEPQSGVADTLNLGLWRLWKHARDRIQLLLQLHDAVLFQCAERDLAAAIETSGRLMKVEVPFERGPLIIPSDCEVGWNFEKRSQANRLTNPDALEKWTGRLTRKRHFTPEVDMLDRTVK